MAEPRVLKLISPAYGDPVYYKWPLLINKKIDEGQEIAETIRYVCEDFPELKYAVENSLLKEIDSRDYECMNQLCQRYNKAIRNILTLWKGRAPPPRMYKPPNKELLRHIITISYNHAVKTPEKLNQYEPFSPEVYGETSFDMIAQILDEVKATKEDCFIDLGSGVGQVVLQAAASNKFKECFGVEKADTPAEFAKSMEEEFRKWMDWFGKIYTEFTLEKGDFLEPKFQDKIDECRFIFVNNFAFGPQLNHSLKTRFQHLKEGSKIISSREFCPMNFKFNKRNLSELGAMMRVSEIKPRSEEASVSWTGNSVNYYLHVVDRTRLEKYFSILKKKKHGQDLEEDELSLYSESNLSIDTTETTTANTESLEENLDDLYLGTTTRHQWQLLNETIKQSKKDAKTKPTPQTAQRKQVAVQDDAKRKSSIPKATTTTSKIHMKNRILKKYGHTRMINRFSTVKHLQKPSNLSTSSFSSSSSESSSSETDEVHVAKKVYPKNPVISKNKTIQKKTVVENREKIVSKSQENVSSEKQSSRKEKAKDTLESEVDNFLGSMKDAYMKFIKRVNTKEYANQLKVMIECEMAKKKILQREVAELEYSIQSLINDGLKNFSSRLLELDVAVKTPVELLSTSTELAERRKELENKVVSMEIEVSGLEEKYRNMCMSRDEKSRLKGLSPLIDSDVEELIPSAEKVQAEKEVLRNKLCAAIVSALNHRKSLIDRESVLSDQICILEKINDGDRANVVTDNSRSFKDMKSSKPNPVVKKKSKTRPVAFVPPRMLSADKKNTISPITSTATSFPINEPDVQTMTSSENQPIRRRGRPKRKQRPDSSRAHSVSSSDTSQDSKADSSGSQSRSRSNLQRSNQAGNIPRQDFSMYNVLENRAPILFPQTTKHGIPPNDNDNEMKSFFKNSSKLLNNSVKQSSVITKHLFPNQYFANYHEKNPDHNIAVNVNGKNTPIDRSNIMFDHHLSRSVSTPQVIRNIETSVQSNISTSVYPSSRLVQNIHNMEDSKENTDKLLRKSGGGCVTALNSTTPLNSATPLNTPLQDEFSHSRDSPFDRANVTSNAVSKKTRSPKKRTKSVEDYPDNRKQTSSFSEKYPHFVAQQDTVISNSLSGNSPNLLSQHFFNSLNKASAASNVDLHFKESLEKFVHKQNQITTTPVTVSRSTSSVQTTPFTMPLSASSVQANSTSIPPVRVDSFAAPNFDTRNILSRVDTDRRNAKTHIGNQIHIPQESSIVQNVKVSSAILSQHFNTSSQAYPNKSVRSISAGSAAMPLATVPAHSKNLIDIPNIPPTASILSTVRSSAIHTPVMLTTANLQPKNPSQLVSTGFPKNSNILPKQENMSASRIHLNSMEFQNGLTLLNSHILNNTTSSYAPIPTSSINPNTVIKSAIVASAIRTPDVPSTVDFKKTQQRKVVKIKRTKEPSVNSPAKRPRKRKPKNACSIANVSGVTVTPELTPISYVVPISDAVKIPSVIPTSNLLTSNIIHSRAPQLVNSEKVLHQQVVNLQLPQPQLLPSLAATPSHPAVNVVQVAAPGVITTSAAAAQRVFLFQVSNSGVITTNSLTNHFERHSSLASPTFPPPGEKL